MAAWLLALAPVVGLAVNVMCQVGSFRLGGSQRLLRSVFVGFACGLAAALGLGLAARAAGELPDGEWAGRLMTGLATCAALGYGYFHFLNLGETARRVRLLREFVEAGGTLTPDEVTRRYNAAAITHARLGRLQRSGQVVCREGRYVIGRPTVLRMARLIGLMKWALLGRAGKQAEVPVGDRDEVRTVASER